MPTQLPAPGDPNALYLLDLSGYVYRAYHALPPLSNSKGEAVNAVMGFANMLERLLRRRRPAFVAVAMDPGDETTFRRTIYSDYKAHRPPPPPDLAGQMARCKQLIDAFAVPSLVREGYEADDMVAAAIGRARAHGLFTVICSADKDLMQLVTDDVVMWDAMRDKVYGADEVREKWGVAPNQLADMLALMGDTSDNVPGVSGIGEKTAAKLLNDYATLDGVYNNLDKLKGKLRDNLVKDRDNAMLSRQLVTLHGDLPVQLELESMRFGGFDVDALKRLLNELEFSKLAEAIPATAALLAGGKPVRASTRSSTKSDASTAQAVLPQAPANDTALPTVESTATTLTSAVPVASEPAPKAPVPVKNVDTAGKTYETILTREQLEAAVAACRAAGRIAVDTETTSIEPARAILVGISLAWKPNHGVYIPVSHRVLGDPPQLSLAVVREVLAPMLADASIRKIGQNAKYDDIVLRRAGLPVQGFSFDTMLASYLLDPERHSHKLDELALGELDYEMIAFDKVTRKERGKQLGFDEVDIATATRYAAEDADITRMLADRLEPSLARDEKLAALMRDLELPLALVLSEMEEHGVLVDVPLLKQLGREVDGELARLEKELHAIAGKEFNVNSPRQLEQILFDELKLPVIKRAKTSRSTDADVLEELASKHPLPGKILEQRTLSKLKGTYLDALPAMVVPATGRIHTSYNQAVAATGRLSSNNPNLQNIPIRTEIGRKIRHAFVPPPGHTLLAADYSQIELRVLAHLSHDEILCDAFRKGEDIHTRTAVEIFKVAPNEVTRTMRDRAKTTNFAVIYGQGDGSLARQLDIPREEAAKFIQTYFQTFTGLRRFLDDVVTQAKDGHGVRTVLGRRRFVPAINSDNRSLRLQAERIAMNTPIQGTAADIMKLAMVTMNRSLREEKLRTKMVLTVHDELVFEVPEDEKEKAGAVVKRVMENVMPLDVPLVVQLGWGATWGQAH